MNPDRPKPDRGSVLGALVMGALVVGVGFHVVAPNLHSDATVRMRCLSNAEVVGHPQINALGVIHHPQTLEILLDLLKLLGD
ncbi:MAG: hypothetical protein RLZZ511_2236 [Cyanobacteriota bacterium]